MFSLWNEKIVKVFACLAAYFIMGVIGACIISFIIFFFQAIIPKWSMILICSGIAAITHLIITIVGLHK